MSKLKEKPSGCMPRLRISVLLSCQLAILLVVLVCRYLRWPQDASLCPETRGQKDQRVRLTPNEMFKIPCSRTDTLVSQYPQVLVSYAYYEKDSGQMENFKFFIMAGIGVRGAEAQLPAGTDFSIVVSGDKCTPCSALSPLVHESTPNQGGVVAMWEGHRLTVMHRPNAGMDFGAHNISLGYRKSDNRLQAYRFFIFLNSSVRGPFFPSYMPAHWRWPDAFIDRLSSEVRIVSSSLVCLPASDAGGPGPRVESWAFSVDAAILKLLIEGGIFWRRSCKLCGNSDGIVVGSEYGMSRMVLEAGYNLATLMSRYSRDTDWRDPTNWSCNDNVHPSRHGTYDDISMHPYETMFVKASWKVGEPYLARYTRWAEELDAGGHGTAGYFREQLYNYAISDEGQNPKNLASNFLPSNVLWLSGSS